LPPGYGISVNTPYIKCLSNDSCVAPPIIQTRLTGGALTDTAVYNETTGLFKHGNYLGPALNRCNNGNCALPGETDVVYEGCSSAVSVFTTDYDAPLGKDQGSFRQALTPLVLFQDDEKKMVMKPRNEIESKSSVWHMVHVRT
jgi:5'-nucleotidase